MNDLGNTIMRLRKEQGLTQEQLANALGISFQAVSKWENNNSCPDIATLPLLADLFGVSIDTLFGRESSPALPLAVQEQAEPPRSELPWPDDDGFYAVLYHGHELIGSQPEGKGRFCFAYEGPAQDVNCAFDLEITGTVYGDVSADGDVTCDEVNGSVNAGRDVTCDTVLGNVSAGGDVTCDDVAGSVSAGGDVTCDDIAGSASAGCDLRGAKVRFESGGDRADLEKKLSGLGEQISAAVKKAAGKSGRFRRSWSFGEHKVEVDLNLDLDEDEE